MRHMIIVLAAIALAIPCPGQDTNQPTGTPSDQVQAAADYTLKRNEVNLGYINLFDLTGPQQLGLGYKHYGEKGAFRVGTGFGVHLNKLADGDDVEKRTGYSLSPRVGYEFHKWYGRVRFHYGGDLAGSLLSSKTKRTDQNPDDLWERSYVEYKLGLKPIIGLTVYLNSWISLSTETGFEFLYEKSVRDEPFNDFVEKRVESGLSTGIGPLGIVSLNIHF